MSASHNSSGTSSTAVSPDASQAISDQISALGSSSPGWLNELNQLGYIPNSATLPATSNVSLTSGGSGNGAVTTPVANGSGTSFADLLTKNYKGGGNAALLSQLGVQYKDPGSTS